MMVGWHEKWLKGRQPNVYNNKKFIVHRIEEYIHTVMPGVGIKREV